MAQLLLVMHPFPVALLAYEHLCSAMLSRSELLYPHTPLHFACLLSLQNTLILIQPPLSLALLKSQVFSPVDFSYFSSIHRTALLFDIILLCVCVCVNIHISIYQSILSNQFVTLHYNLAACLPLYLTVSNLRVLTAILILSSLESNTQPSTETPRRLRLSQEFFHGTTSSKNICYSPVY